MNHNPSRSGGGGPPARRSGGGNPPNEINIEYPLPSDTVAVLKGNRVSNPGLAFERYLPYLGIQKQQRRKEALEGARNAPDQGALQAAYARWQALVQVAGATPFTLATDWRFIPGLGRKTALEIGFSFHRYGFPYLPGSSVKGIARTCALFELASFLGVEEGKLSSLDKTLEKEENEFQKEFVTFKPSDKVWEKAKIFRRVFGTLDQAGGAIFFDAIPTTAFPLDMDIMNPHYAPYYQEKEPPGDWHNPTPITFLAVPAGKPFAFAVAWRRGAPHADLLTHAVSWLKQGLQELGAGAKTAAGYGYFREQGE